MPVPKSQTLAGLEPAGGSDVANGSAVWGRVRDVAYMRIDDIVTLQLNERSGMQYLYCSGTASYPQYPKASAKLAVLSLSSQVERYSECARFHRRGSDGSIQRSCNLRDSDFVLR
jgi:hypothetical protein